MKMKNENSQNAVKIDQITKDCFCIGRYLPAHHWRMKVRAFVP